MSSIKTTVKDQGVALVDEGSKATVDIVATPSANAPTSTSSNTSTTSNKTTMIAIALLAVATIAGIIWWRNSR